MSGIGGSEFILLCLIGLLILGPERLPRVARQLGSWVGKARQITRGFQRQLEEELSAEKNLGFDPKELKNLNPNQLLTPNEDDTYSPMHVEEESASKAADVAPNTAERTRRTRREVSVMARTQDEDQEETLAEGTLLSHLVELRTRLFWMFGAVFLIFLALLPFSKMIFNYVAAPLVSVVPNGELLALSPVSPLTATIALTFYIALFIAMPVILYQAWAFIAPGLYRKEKRFAFPLFATSVVLFFVGMAFAYYVVFPLIFGFVSTFTPDTVNYQPDMTEYVSFVMMVVLVFGLAFETPIATVLLVITGLTTTEKLGKARPYVFLGAFVIGMLLTPPDVISQTMLAVPVYLLYEMGILMSRIVRPSGNDVAEDASNGV